MLKGLHLLRVGVGHIEAYRVVSGLGMLNHLHLLKVGVGMLNHLHLLKVGVGHAEPFTLTQSMGWAL